MIDTRVKKTLNYTDDFDEVDEDPLENAIQTKYVPLPTICPALTIVISRWEGACVDWQGLAHYL